MTKNGGIIIMSEQEEKIKRHAKVVSFINMKGGVAKTTLCKELGIKLSENNKILFIDLDPQSNLTQSLFEIFDILKSNNVTSMDSLNENTRGFPNINKLYDSGNTEPLKSSDLILPLDKTNDMIDLIPGSLDSTFYGKSTGSENEQALRNFIKRVGIIDNYDFVFIDCPPTYSTYTTAAILASDYYLIPVTPEAYSALGIDLLEHVVSKIKDSYSDTFELKPIDSLGIVFTKLNENSEGEQRIKNEIIDSPYFKNIKKFKNYLSQKNKLSTVKLSYLISRSNDNKLKTQLSNITEEFLEEIEKNEEHRKRISK